MKIGPYFIRPRGLVHTAEYVTEMAEIQRRFNAEYGVPDCVELPVDIGAARR